MRLEMMEMTIDSRLSELRQDLLALDLEEETLTIFCAYMRAAYAHGLVDAIREREKILATYEDLGYKI